MLPKLALTVVLALALAGCGSSAAPSPSPSAEPTPSPTALDAFGQANPGLAGAVQASATTPNVRLAVNKLLGNALVAISIPSQGLPLATIGQSISAQFQAVPGLASKPVAESERLPSGDALHWALALSVNKAGGGTLQVNESVHLIASPTTAVLVEFVVPNGGTNPDETKIIRTLRFRP